MSNNNFWNNDSYSNIPQPNESSRQNDEWSWGNEWSYVDQSAKNKSLNTQQNTNPQSIENLDTSLNDSYSISAATNESTQPTVTNCAVSNNIDNRMENGQHNFAMHSNNWFEKSDSQSELFSNTKAYSNIHPENDVNKKFINVVEHEDNFWADVENREILPPESFQNESIQVAMNSLQINNHNKVIGSNTCDSIPITNVDRNNYTKNNSVENDGDRPPVGLHRLVTGQTKSFEDNSENKDFESCGPQPFDVRTVPGQLSDDDIPTQRHVTGSQIGARSIDNNLNLQNQDNNSVTLKRLPSLEHFQNQFEGHSRQVLHRDFEDFVNQTSDNQKLDESVKTDIDDSFRNESHSELKEPTTVIKKSRPRVQDPEVFERTGPDGYMNETSPYIRSTVQNHTKPGIDSHENNLKLSSSNQLDTTDRFQNYDKTEKRNEKKHPPPPGFHRMVEGNIGEEGVQKYSQPRNNQKNDEHLRRHSIDSDSSVPMANIVSEEGHKNARRGLQQKKYSKNLERYQNRDKRPPYRHRKESEEDYFYEEEEANNSQSPDVEPEYRSHRSRNHQFKHYKHRNPHENYDHSDLEYQSEYDEFDEYERRRRYRSPESDRYRRPPVRSYRDRRYQEEISNNYFKREDSSYRNRPSSRTDSDYHRRYSPVPIQDCMAQIDMLNPVEKKKYLLKFRERDPKGYTEWYANYKAKVEMQKLLSRTKNGSQCSTPISTQSHDIGHLSNVLEQEREIHRTTPPRYPKYHINAKMSMAFGKLFLLDSSNATLSIIKISPDPDDTEAAELYKFPSPFVLGKTHKNVVTQYLNKLVEEVSNNSERLLYELISMITKRSGIVDGTDISEMLMENVAKYPVEGILFESMSMKNIKEMSGEPLKHFRDLLLQGNKSEALEFAIQSQNWGLAFVLGSYMDLKTFNYIKSKFFQTIPSNDTLQTFFQLNSGKVPSCTTCCTDSTWGDWREHLAMILSNQHVNINNAYNAILQLGDTLGAKGDIFGAHFCYLTSYMPVEPGMPSKFTLLGTSSNQPFNTNTSNRVILITSAYEFAIRLNNSNFFIPSLLPYKYLLAVRLAEYGECEYALQYLEAIATQVIASPISVNTGFVSNIVDLGTDLHYMQMSNINLSGVMDTLDWLEDLKHVLSNSGSNYNAENNVNNVLPTQQIEQQTNPINYSNEPIEPYEQQNIPDLNVDHSVNYEPQTPPQELPPQVVQPPPVNPYWQPSAVSQAIIEPSLQAGDIQ
ncbi:uncharacterized protein LOC126847123 isoform X2 [Adelges cooleyi]|uniref:uncharacterized protein LOC126847123 isoform X2 n=1 Tax=Adelges cooleyi TaxID=133065 RepID=UPI00217F4D26|nr:uncharacterized protein LOC126847123 isoform X2 [Adelges cooleyi]